MQEEKASYDKPDIFCPCNIQPTDYITNITTNNEVQMNSLSDFIVPAFSASLPFAFLLFLMSCLRAEADTTDPVATVVVVDSEIEIIDATTILR